MTEVVRPYRGVSAIDRRAARRDQLVEAVLEVVRVEGVAGATVGAVCATAQLTKRYFYESFPDLDALLVAAVDELLVALRTRMDEDVRQNPPGPARTHAVVTTLIDTLADDPRFARLYAGCAGHPVLLVRREESITAFTEFVVTEVLPEPGLDLSADDRQLATWLLVAGTTELVTSWLSGAIDADRDTIIATIERVGAGL